MTILETYMPELPVDSETPSSSQWQWSNEDMRNYALAAVAAYREKLMEQKPVYQIYAGNGFWLDVDEIGYKNVREYDKRIFYPILFPKIKD